MRPDQTSIGREEQLQHSDEAAVIKIVPGDLPAVVNAAEDALYRAHVQIYNRAGRLVRPVYGPLLATELRVPPPSTIEDVSDRWLQEKLTEVADFRKLHAPSERWRRVDCPYDVAKTLIARRQWRFPPLTAIVSTPTLRADGTLVQIEGYDRTSQLILNYGGTCFPQVSNAPALEDCRNAFVILREAFCTFSLGPVDEAVLISGLLTALVRRSLSTAPMHVVTAHTAGSGKSLAVDVISIVATGRPCSVYSIGQKQEELEKRLGSALLLGEHLISLDNVGRPVESDFLCQVLSQRSAKVRPLGQSIVVEAPTSATFFLTGNNVRLVGDLNRRSLVAQIGSNVERPETRSFSRDARAYAGEHRAALVHAALTLLRGYAVANRPVRSAPLGSFEDWSRVVRDAIIWVGGSDPCESQEHLRSADPELEELRAVMVLWKATFGGQKVKVSEVIDQASTLSPTDFKLALLAVAGAAGDVDSRRLGRWLQKVAGRLVRGMKFVRAGETQGSALWRLEG